ELVSQGVFTKIHHGSVPEDFANLDDGDDLVVLAGSPGSVEVLEYLVGLPSSASPEPPQKKHKSPRSDATLRLPSASTRVKLVHSL
ncbi:gyaR, partial [Symbiodinium microadriaticum]